MTYLKVKVLVPAHIVRYLIGYEGNNIKWIKSISSSRVLVQPELISNAYQHVELEGSVKSIVKAFCLISRLVKKYFFFNKENKPSEAVSQPEKQEEDKSDLEVEFVIPTQDLCDKEQFVKFLFKQLEVMHEVKIGVRVGTDNKKDSNIVLCSISGKTKNVVYVLTYLQKKFLEIKLGNN